MKEEIIKIITTDKGVSEFQIRFLQEEGVGLLTTKEKDNYLILDSLDYWYDLIQSEYPKKKKCSCKNEYFHVQFHYMPRQGTNDIREIYILTTCTNCNKKSKPISIDIDYSPTDKLIKKPISFCQKPNIKYKFRDLSSYWFESDLIDFLQYIFNEQKLNVYCWYWQHSDNKRYFEKVTFEKAIKIITANHLYLNFYFTENELDTSKYTKLTDDKGVYLQDGVWRKNEIIELSSPTTIVGYGVLYYIRFCNQYLDKGNVADKSTAFEKITNSLEQWLQDKFVTKRGKNCFDGHKAYEKFMSKTK